jgi:hypothetical protein
MVFGAEKMIAIGIRQHSLHFKTQADKIGGDGRARRLQGKLDGHRSLGLAKANRAGKQAEAGGEKLSVMARF